MRPALVVVRRDLQQLLLDLLRRRLRREPRPVRHTKHMRIHGNRRLAKRLVQHHARRLVAHPRQRHQILPRARRLAPMLLKDDLRQRDHILRLAPPQPDRLDVAGDAFLAERHHLRRRIGHLEQFLRRLVHRHIGRLRRKRHGDHERIGIGVDQLRLRIGPVLGQSPEQLPRHLRREAASALLRCLFRRRLRHASLKPSPGAMSSGSCALRVAA